MSVTPEQVIAEARTWIGTPWQHQQRMKGVGVDCAGLVIGVARAIGVVPADMDVNGYPRVPDGVTLMAHCEHWLIRKPLADRRPGDVLVFRFSSLAQHLGILGDYPHGGMSLIHALDRAGKKGGSVVEHRLAGYFQVRALAAFAMPGVQAA